MSRSPSPLESLLARVAGEISSQTLKLDPTSYPRLEDLAGTRIRFDVLPPAVPGLPGATTEARTVLLTVHPDALTFEAGSTEDAHAVISGTLPDIVRTFFSKAEGNDKTGNGPGGVRSNVRIDGDEAALQAVAALFGDLQPDLAEPLARVIGREAADSLVGAAEAGFAFLRSAAESLASGAAKQAGNAWVTEEAQDSLMNRLDDLRLRIDRLDARVRLVEEKASSSGPDAP